MTIIEDNDLAARYAATRPAPTPPPARTIADREKDLAAEITTAGTLADYLVNGTRQRDLRIQSLVRAGRTAEAREEWLDRNDAVDVNYGGMTAVSSMKGSGANANRLRELAEREVLRKFNDDEVTTVDGRTFKMGEYFADDGPWKDPGSAFRDRGYSKRAVNAFLTGKYSVPLPDGSGSTEMEDEELKRSMGYFMKDATAVAAKRMGLDVDPMHIQNNEAADAVCDSWKAIRDTFGDGASRFVQYVHETHRDSGAAAPFLKALLKLGAAHSASTGLTGEALVDHLMGSYRGILALSSRGDAGPDGSPARPVSANRRLMTDVMLIKTLARLEQAGGTGYANMLDDDRVQAGIRDCMSIVAECTANGMDLVSEADGRKGPGHVGNLFDAFADFLSNRARGMPDDGSFVDNYRRFSEGLRGQVTGGTDFVPMPKGPSGDVTDHQKLLRMAGGRSSCPEADNMAAGVHRMLRRIVVPYMTEGKTAQQAWAEIDQDLEASDRRKDMLVGELAKSFSGKGAKAAATQLAETIIDAVRNNTQVNIQDAIMAAASNRAIAETDPYMYTSFRNWVYGMTEASTRYARQLKDLDLHWASESGGSMSDKDRAAALSRVKSRIAELDRATENKIGVMSAGAYLDSLLNRGTIFFPVRRKVRNPATGELVKVNGEDQTEIAWLSEDTDNFDRRARELSAIAGLMKAGKVDDARRLAGNPADFDDLDYTVTAGMLASGTRMTDPGWWHSTQSRAARFKKEYDQRRQLEVSKQIADSFKQAAEARKANAKNGGQAGGQAGKGGKDGKPDI